MWHYHFFLYYMLLEILYFGRYVAICWQHNTTRHVAFVMAIACVSILSAEWVRVFFIVVGVFEAHQRDLLWWALEHLPFGGFWIARLLEKYRKIKSTDHDSTGQTGRSSFDAA